MVDHSKPYHTRKVQPWYKYLLLKANVDWLNIIQVGLTLADANENLSDFGENSRALYGNSILGILRDLQAPNAIEMLRQQARD